MKKIQLFTLLHLLLMLAFGETLHASEINQPAPPCALKKFSVGETVDLQQFQGEVVYVDFWASWCPPCLRSFPFMNQISQQHTEQGLKIIAINLDEDPDDAVAFLNRSPAQFEVVVDPEQQCAKAFDVKAMPSSYIIDRAGNIRHVHLGFKSDETEQLQAKIEQLLQEPAIAAP